MTAAVMICTAAFSQGEPAGGARVLSIGPSVGFGHAGVRNTAGTDVFNPWWTAGVIINYSTSEHIGFAADVLWSMEGARIEDGEGIETDLALQYVRVPLKFAYFMGDFEDGFRPKVTIGPSMGFLVDADADNESTGTTDVKSTFESFDLGANASIGFNWKMGDNMWLNTDFNYYHGFLEISPNQYNSNFGLKVGLAFGL